MRVLLVKLAGRDWTSLNHGQYLSLDLGDNYTTLIFDFMGYQDQSGVNKLYLTLSVGRGQQLQTTVVLYM